MKTSAVELNDIDFKAISEAITGQDPVPVPPDRLRGSHRPLKPSQTLFDGIPWTPSDRPLFELGKGWVLATDDDLQWIVYRRQGKQWLAVRFHCEKGGLLRTIKEKVISPYPDALAGIEAWDLQTVQIKTSDRTITIEGHYKEWLKQQEKEMITE